MYTNKEIKALESIPVDETDARDFSTFHSDFEIETCIQWIRQCHATKVCLQFSQDLLSEAPRIVHALEENLHHKVYVIGDTSYGTCCIDEVRAQHVEADAIIHYGHSCLSPSERIPVFYVFRKNILKCSNLIACLKTVFTCNDKIMLLYDVSYYHAVSRISGDLKKTFSNLVIAGLAVKDSLSLCPPVLGRVFEVSDDDLRSFKIVFIGEDGSTSVNFKYIFPEQPFYIYNADAINLYEINTSLFLRKRMYFIECLKNARTLGLLIGTLSVKSYLLIVERIKNLAKGKGIKCYIVSVGQINVAKLANFPEIDAYVLISCAENSLLDSKEFLQPVVTPYEVELAYNKAYQWTDKFITDYTTLLPGSKNHVEEPTNPEDNETNVSLVSGRTSKVSDLTQDLNAIVTKGIDSLSVTESRGVNFLTSRSWHGLEPKLGESTVETAVKGRSGIPFKYDSEN